MEILFAILCFRAFLFFIVRWAVQGADNQGVGPNRRRRRTPGDPEYDADVDDD
jgi:hypothetical protein